MLNEINEESEKFIDEGYGRQGSRMAYHRFNSVVCDFHKVLNDPDQNVFLFVQDKDTGQILGSASLLHCDNGLPELSNFYLSKETRRKADSPKVGLGKYLLSRMLVYARDKGCREVFLTSRRQGGFEKALNPFVSLALKRSPCQKRWTALSVLNTKVLEQFR